MFLLNSESFFFFSKCGIEWNSVNKKSRCLIRQTELLITPYSLKPVLSGPHSLWVTAKYTFDCSIISHQQCTTDFFSLTFLLTDIVLNVITANALTSSALILHLT